MNKYAHHGFSVNMSIIPKRYLFAILFLLSFARAEAFCFTPKMRLVNELDTLKTQLWDSFMHPRDEARTKLWWFHGETETTREGIDADLKAFKEAGIGGVVFYDQTHGAQEGAFPSLTPEWWEMLKYAALRARELGLTFEIAASNGYVAGGPWVTPELGMQKIVVLRPGDTTPKNFTKLMEIPSTAAKNVVDTCIQRERITLKDDEPAMITFDAGRRIKIRTISYSVTPRGKGSFGSMNIPGKPQERYFGAGYVDMPPIGELQYSNDGKRWQQVIELRGIEDVIGHKSRQRTLNFPAVKARYFRLNIHNWQGPVKDKYTKLEIEDVRLLSYDMIDNWEVKSGLRCEVSYPLNLPEAGISEQHSSDESNTAITKQVSPQEDSKSIIIGYAPTGGQAKHGRLRIVWNGKELQSKTWLESDVMSAKAAENHYNSYFRAIYDTLSAIGCRPMGMCMDSHEAGIANWTAEMPQHFKRLRGYDISKWIPALAGYIVENREKTEAFLRDYRLTISELVGEQFYGTLARLCRRDGITFTSQAMLGCVNDNIASRGMVDKPQGEFWAYQKNGNYDCLDAASSAHLYNKKIASGEAFTDTPYFTGDDISERGWHKLLRIANLAYCRGVNEFVVCASSYQPWMDRKYNDDASLHPYIFHRHNPVWNLSREHFWEYQARCSQMMQMGRPVVDVLVYLGDDAPLKTLAYRLPVIPEGYNFDVCTLRSLRYWASLGSAQEPSFNLDNAPWAPQYKIIVVEPRTEISPEAEQLFNELSQRGIKIIRGNGKETIAQYADIVAAGIVASGVHPDMSIKSKNEPDDKTFFYHRQTDDADIYFIYNHSSHDYTTPLLLRTQRKNIELWDALTGKRTTVTDGTLMLRPYESKFIICE